MSYRCLKCDPPRRFGSISKLRVHQRSVHKEDYVNSGNRGGGKEEAPAPVVKVAKRKYTRKQAAMPHSSDALEALEMSLIGYQQRLRELDTQIAQVTALFNGHRAPAAVEAPASVKPAKGKKRRMSAEGRARIAAAQRKRWAAAKATAV